MSAVSGPMSNRNEFSETWSASTLDQGRSEAGAAENRIIGANVDFYRQIAAKYESCEGYLFAPFLQRGLEDDLDKIGSYFVSLGRTPTCLECGGGTGRLTLKMCARGWTVTVVDVSEDMLDLLQERAHSKSYSPTLIRSPIERFLAMTNETYDLVAFSAVLHHLYFYASVVERAASRVAPGGLFYSNWDPAIPQNPFWTRAFDSIDTAAAKLMLDPRDVLPGIWRRARKLFRRNDPRFGRPVVSAGDLAEFHAKTGVDDAQIVRILEARGFEIIEHQRIPVGRTRVAHLLNRRFRLLENFKIMARRAE